MIWTVIWQPPTEDDLADLWMGATDRDAITHAANTIDHILRTDPFSFGESRSGNRRILIVEPVAVLYEVRQDDCLIIVTSVWLWKA